MILLLALAGCGDGTKRLLVRVFDATPTPEAQTGLAPLSPTFDGTDTPRPQLPVTLQPAIEGIPQPTDLAFVPGHPTRVVVLSKPGQASLGDVASGEHTPWFEVEVATTSELGLLGIAFHPGFEQTGRFWINHTPGRGGERASTVITEWHTDPRTLSAPTRVADILEVPQPYQNHNAGQLAFGADGMLYVGLGDGGFRADPLGSGQDRSTLLGSVLRLDVSEPGAYSVPPDNPFVGEPGTRPEIWAYGLRNPWRLTFDPTGRLVVADVGQNAWEEIDLVEAGNNLGWNRREGAHCFDAPEGCATEGLVDPIYEYGRADGVSVTGGVVVTAEGPLHGRYLFADFGSGRVWALELPSPRARVPTATALGRFSLNPSAFGRDAAGHAWVADYSTGGVFRVAP